MDLGGAVGFLLADATTGAEVTPILPFLVPGGGERAVAVKVVVCGGGVPAGAYVDGPREVVATGFGWYPP